MTYIEAKPMELYIFQGELELLMSTNGPTLPDSGYRREYQGVATHAYNRPQTHIWKKQTHEPQHQPNCPAYPCEQTCVPHTSTMLLCECAGMLIDVLHRFAGYILSSYLT